MDCHDFEHVDFLHNVGYDYESYASVSDHNKCPSISSSFLTIDTTSMSFDGSVRDSNGSTSPENLTMSSATSVRSPVTPLGSSSMNTMYNSGLWNGSQYHEGWHHRAADREISWPGVDEFAMVDCVMNSLPNQNPSMFQPGYFNPTTKPKGNPDPPLSRAVFAYPAAQNEHAHDEIDSWPHAHNIIHPVTVEPSVTVQNTLPSSPLNNFEPITPLKHHRGHSSVFASSPLTGVASSTLPSGWESEDAQFMPDAEIHDQNRSQILPHQLRYVQDSPIEEGSSSPLQSHSSKSGVECEAIIPQNIYACSVAGCVDKNGKPKRFKRQEHKKRHEKTVHKKDAKFPCWVRTGGKACGREFTRRDNLNSHLKKTHGRRSNNQRNSYVATLDEKSEYFDEKWKGQLTSEGLPIGHPRWPALR